MQAKPHSSSASTLKTFFTNSNTIGFVYDIPKNEGITNAELAALFKDQHYETQVQIITKENRPFLTARVKFPSEDQLTVALDQFRYFKIRGKDCRMLGYDTMLQRNSVTLQRLHSSKVDLNKISYDQLISTKMPNFSEDQVNLPDNSLADCNLFVKGLDKTYCSSDLHQMFRGFGEIKSAKLSLNPATHHSRGYGFIWFADEKSAQDAIQASINGSVPMTCALYKPRSLQDMMTKPFYSIVIKNFPINVTESMLTTHFQALGDVKFCQIFTPASDKTTGVALITFQTTEQAQKAVAEYHGKSFNGNTLYVQPSMTQKLFEKLQTLTHPREKFSQIGLTLYIQNIPKATNYESFRKFFAMHGQIQLLNLVEKPGFDSAIAYLVFKNPLHAENVLKLKSVSFKGKILKVSVFGNKIADKENMLPPSQINCSDQGAYSEKYGITFSERRNPLGEIDESVIIAKNPEQSFMSEDVSLSEVERVQQIQADLAILYSVIKRSLEECERRKLHEALTGYAKLTIELREIQREALILKKAELTTIFVDTAESNSDSDLANWLRTFQSFDLFAIQTFMKAESQLA